MNFLKGLILAFDKPYRDTSFSIVGRVRKMISTQMEGKKIKVGHAGTLDPLATGVLLLCTGRATKMIEQLQSGTKEYIAQISLGATTPSFDLETNIDATYPTSHLTESLILNTLPNFQGEIMQIPPAFSACKIQGKRAYDLAREGQEVILHAKPLHIDSIELIEAHLPNTITLRIVCSKGTYIRALARDLGIALGTGAHLSALQRTRIGSVTLQQCWSLPQFEKWITEQSLSTELPEGPIPKKFPYIFPTHTSPHFTT